MLQQFHRATTRIALVAGGAALFGVMAGTGGAVAAKLVTSADIKNGTIETRDVSPAALTQFDGLNGYEVINNSVVVPAKSDGSLTSSCDPTKRTVGVYAFWDNQDEAIQSTVLSDGSGGIAFAHNSTKTDDTLNLRIVCADLSSIRQGPA